jgi:hypothetical protein
MLAHQNIAYYPILLENVGSRRIDGLFAIYFSTAGRAANPCARHRSWPKARLKLAGVPNPSVCEGFGF